MKDIFKENNYTNSDVAQNLFEKHWINSSSSNANKEAPFKVRLLSSGNSGYGTPAPISFLHYPDDDYQEESEE